MLPQSCRSSQAGQGRERQLAVPGQERYFDGPDCPPDSGHSRKDLTTPGAANRNYSLAWRWLT